MSLSTICKYLQDVANHAVGRWELKTNVEYHPGTQEITIVQFLCHDGEQKRCAAVYMTKEQLQSILKKL